MFTQNVRKDLFSTDYTFVSYIELKHLCQRTSVGWDNTITENRKYVQVSGSWKTIALENEKYIGYLRLICIKLYYTTKTMEMGAFKKNMIIDKSCSLIENTYIYTIPIN